MSAELKWTPGPWVATSAAHPEQGVVGMGYRLAKMTGGEPQRDRANATLMSSAPDLYAELAEVLRKIRNLGIDHWWIEDALDADDIEAALSKSRGEA
jgi:hypothetical protein